MHAGEERGADQRRKVATLRHLSVMVDGLICGRCNSGFLAGLEKSAKRLLAPKIQTACVGTLDVAEQGVIATWATKTAWLLELAARQMWPGERRTEGPVPSEVELAWLGCHREPPPRALVWMAHWDCERRDSMMHAPSVATLPTESGEIVSGQFTTFSLGYVAFQVFSVDFVEADTHGAALWNTAPPKALAESVARIWPSLCQRVEWPGKAIPRAEWTRLVTWDGVLLRRAQAGSVPFDV